jgi:3-hydroxyacyl-[acyl-carrier-protein] dehydratase
MTDSTVLDVEQIKLLLPHRAPMLFVEKLADIVPNESATGYKAVSINEPFFMGHFPERAVMPGVLIVEAMAQTAGALVVHSQSGQASSVVYFMTIEKARFRKPVHPGEMLRMPVKLVRRRDPVPARAPSRAPAPTRVWSPSPTCPASTTPSSSTTLPARPAWPAITQ